MYLKIWCERHTTFLFYNAFLGVFRESSHRTFSMSLRSVSRAKNRTHGPMVETLDLVFRDSKTCFGTKNWPSHRSIDHDGLLSTKCGRCFTQNSNQVLVFLSLAHHFFYPHGALSFRKDFNQSCPLNPTRKITIRL